MGKWMGRIGARRSLSMQNPDPFSMISQLLRTIGPSELDRARERERQKEKDRRRKAENKIKNRDRMRLARSKK